MKRIYFVMAVTFIVERVSGLVDVEVDEENVGIGMLDNFDLVDFTTK